MMSSRTHPFLNAACLSILTTSLVLSQTKNVAAPAAPDITDITKAFPARNGLAVQVGATDAAFLASLTADGGRLVHGLTQTDSTRDSIRAVLHRKGIHPLATVATWYGAPSLPYADRLVNLLIIDRDALGAQAPSRAECQRVMAPGGAMLERLNGKWTSVTLDRPKSLGDWCHYDGGANGNAVSSDTEITGIHSWQWIDNFRNPRWVKTGPHGGDEGNIRSWGRYAVWDYKELGKNYNQSSRLTGKFPDDFRLVCRDVFNGLPIWEKSYRGGGLGSKRALVADQGQCFTWMKDGGPLVAIDLATGTELRSYPGSEIKAWQDLGKKNDKPRMRQDVYKENHWIRVTGNTVLANGDGTLRAWTMEAKPLWSFARAGLRVEMPIVDATRKMVYAILVNDSPIGEGKEGPVVWGRWPSSEAVHSFVALSLTTGQMLWENTELASKDTGLFDIKTKRKIISNFGQILCAGDYLVAYGNKAIAGGNNTMAASMDIKTGKTVHFNPKDFVRNIRQSGEVEWDDFLYTAVYRDGLVWIMNGSRLMSIDPATGKINSPFALSWNSRCFKPVATADHFIIGQTAFIKRDMSGEMIAVARSGCTQSAVPASGLLMFGPHMCACVTHFDGFLSLSPRVTPPALPENVRLLKPAPPALKPPPPNDPPASLVAAAWPWYTISVDVSPATVAAGGWSFAIDPARQRVDAKNPTGGAWSWVADARIGTSVVVNNHIAVFGTHDGWVHGLDLATGTPKWKYLATPAQRLAIANSMLTSTWPVFGVADLGAGLVVATAGTHAELDGGIRVVALKISDGSLAWTRTVVKTRSQISASGKKVKIADRSVINTAPTVVDGKVMIAGGEHLGKFAIDLAETEQAMNARISAPPLRR